MKTRVFLLSILVICLMSCSKKPAYVGNTYEGNIEGIIQLSYGFINEHEFSFNITAPEEYDINESFVCHYITIAEELNGLNPDLCKPVKKFMDGCEIIEVDSVFYLDGDKDRVSLEEFCKIEGQGRTEMYKDVMLSLLYNDKTDEIVVVPFDNMREFFATKFLNVVNAEREKTGKASIAKTCREDLPSLPGVRCTRKVEDKKKTNNEIPAAKTEPEPVRNDEEACVITLQKYYTASREQIAEWGGETAFETERFIEYTKCLDFIPLTSTQDYDIGDGLVVESIEPYANLDHAYIVMAKLEGGFSGVPTCVIMKEEEGTWKIDNISLEPYEKVFFDYSKPASRYYAFPDCGGDVIEEPEVTEDIILPETGDIVY